MNNDKKIFLGLNADIDQRFLKETEYINAENVYVGMSENTKENQVTNFPSTVLLHYYTNADFTIGRCVDYNRNRLIYINHRFNGEDVIYAYDIDARVNYTVL